MPATYRAKVADQGLYPLRDAIADLYGRAERALFVDHHVRGRALSECKREYITGFGLTARQCNAVRVSLDGRVAAARAGQKNRIADLRDAIPSAQKAVKTAERDLAKLRTKKERPAQTAEPGRRRRFTLHQKKRRLHTLEHRLAAARADQEAGRVRLCFGGTKMFHAQFHREAHGFADGAAWRAAWRQRRSAQFLCLGSQDERAGNPTCTRLPNGALRLRVPPGLEETYGRHVLVPDRQFAYGQSVIDAALRRGEAVTWRFLWRDDKKAWYVHASVERPAATITTDRRLGALGVDFNPAHADAGAIDRVGNPVGERSFRRDLAKKTQARATAALSEVASDIVAGAKTSGKPLGVEGLDFRKKKAALRERSPRYARMRSAFAYRTFFPLLFSRAAREGVEIVEVNPAFTRVIGEVKFAPGYGLSSHGAAAVAIARRGLRFGERRRSRTAFPLPARNRGQHVWSDWRRVARRLRAGRARGRRPSEGGRGRGQPLSSAAPARASAGQGPSCDGFAAVPGRDTPAQTVGKTVRPAYMV